MNYCVDSIGGNDTNPGTESLPWKSLSKAVSAPLLAGDSLLFMRGREWVGKGKIFQLSRIGTEAAPITIGAYGIGPSPKIILDAMSLTGEQQAFYITNSAYLNIQNLFIGLINPFRSPLGISDGQNVKFGWYVGINIAANNHHITITDCEMEHLSVGVNLTDATHHCRVLNNWIHDLDVFWRVDGAAGAMGAIAVQVHGDDHEVGYLRSERNWVECQRVSDNTLQSYGAPFEVYNANRCRFHHTRAFEFRKSFEMGKDAPKTCDDNRFDHNLLVSARINARGPNIHGSDVFGPVKNTLIECNTIILTGAGSESLVSGGPGTIIRDNILQAVTKAIYLSGGTEHHNLYWGGQVQLMNMTMSPASKKSDPLLDTSYLPKSNSPARGLATDGGTVGASLSQGASLMPVITDLQEAVTFLKAQATAKAAEATALTAQADKLTAMIATLQAADAQLNSAANVIDPG